MADRSTFIINLKALGFDKVADGFKKVADKAKTTFQNLGKVQQNQKKIQSNKIRQLGDRSAKAAMQVKGLNSGLLLMGNNLKGLVILGVKRLAEEFVTVTDQINRVKGQMELFTGSVARAEMLTRQLQDATIDTGWDLDALSSTMTKLGVGLEQFGHTEEDLIDITKGLGLIFRDMGADGDKLAKVSGNLAQLFTRTVVPFEKLESLLGRGKHEQLFRGVGQELVKIKNIDLTAFGNKGKNAMAIVEREMKKGAVSGEDLHKALVNITKARLDQSIVPTEIGHGFDQLAKAGKVALGRFDEMLGISNDIAETFHDWSQNLKDFTDEDMKKAEIRLLGWIEALKELIRLVGFVPLTVAKKLKENLSVGGDQDDLIGRLGQGAYARRESARIEQEIADLQAKIDAGYTGEEKKTRRPRTEVTPREEDEPTAAVPQDTAGGTALTGLANQLANIDAASRQSLITGEQEVELKARLNEQVLQTQAAHALELETNDRLANQYQVLLAFTDGYAASLKAASTETKKTTTTTKKQSLTFKMVAHHSINAGNAVLGLVSAMDSVKQGSGGLITKLGQVASAIASAAQQAGLNALGPYGAAAGVGLQVLGAVFDRKKTEPAQTEAPACPEDKATGDPCSQPTTDAAMATTRAVEEQTQAMLTIEQERSRGLEIQNKLLEDQLLAMPKYGGAAFNTPNVVGNPSGSPTIVIQNINDPREIIEETMASEAGQLVIRNTLMEDRELTMDMVS